MKGKITAIAFFTTMAMASSVTAQDGQVNFTGKIIEEGCQVNSSVTNPMEVKLGEVAKTAFAASGDTAATTKFTLILTGCPDALKGKPVAVKYDGTPDTANNDYLQLTNYGGTGIAKGVAIQLLNGSGSALPLGNESEKTTISSTADTNLDFFARYISTTDLANVGAGDANGTANFTLTYN